MTPKEKALEIFNKMCNSVDELLPLDVRDCALIAVDEVLSIPYLLKKETWFYNEVKKEIEKL